MRGLGVRIVDMDFQGIGGGWWKGCVVEMNGNETDEGKWGSGVCVLNPGEMGGCNLLCSFIGTVILFCNRLCLIQKTYYWKHKSFKQNITMNISPYAGIEATLRFFFFSGKIYQSLLLAWTQEICMSWDSKENECTDFTKKYWSKLGQWFYSFIEFAYIPLRCSLLQPQI